VEQDKEHERDYWKTFDDAVEWRLQTRTISKQHEIDSQRLEEWHQLGTNALQLQEINKKRKIVNLAIQFSLYWLNKSFQPFQHHLFPSAQ